MRWEELRPALSLVAGPAAAVGTPVKALARMGFFDTPGSLRVIFYPTRHQVRAARRAHTRMGLAPARFLMGSLSGLPFRRRFLGLVVAPFPDRRDPDLLRCLRRTAGVLGDEGIIVLHGPVRRNPLGWGLHLMHVLMHRQGGLPTEWDLTGWALRGGFNRVVRLAGGRAVPFTIIQATKSFV